MTATLACQREGRNGYVFLPEGYGLNDGYTVGRDSFWYIKDGKLTGKMFDTSRTRTCKYCQATLIAGERQ